MLYGLSMLSGGYSENPTAPGGLFDRNEWIAVVDTMLNLWEAGDRVRLVGGSPILDVLDRDP